VINKVRAFTLIELLIVVAIIGILAAIAVPNFLNAQLKAKISRVQADFNMLRTGLESYFIDKNGYPRFTEGDGPTRRLPNFRRYIDLTTPVAYVSQVPVDPFAVFANQADYNNWGNAYDYVTDDSPNPGRTYGHRWQINSWGPDQTNTWLRNYPGDFYNISNGLLSHGDIGMFGPRSSKYPEKFKEPLPHF
jgi:type II secretion system protein G